MKTRWRVPLALVCLALVSMSACARSTDESADPTESRSPITRPSTDSGIDLQLSGFTPGELPQGTVVPNTAGPDATVVYPEDRSAPPLQVTDDRGSVVTFPDPCSKGPDCVRGILEIPADPALNPGTRDFTLAVELKARTEDLRDGTNVTQKGFSTGGESQWKLQIDDSAGRPSCVLVGVQGHQQIALSQRSVTDGDWHLVECRRSGGTLRVLVDGNETGRSVIGKPVDVMNPFPVRIGAKHTKPNGDPFFGSIAGVRLQID